MDNEQHKQKEAVDLSRVRLILSDWDGTIVDSMSSYASSFADILQTKFQIPREQSTSFYLKYAGTSLSGQFKDAIKTLANKEVNDTLPYEEQFWNQLRGLEPNLLPGAREFLASLYESGFMVVIWSGSRTEVLGKAIKSLDLQVDYYIGNKPGDPTMVKGPALFDQIASHLGEDQEKLRSQTLVIGDGIGDIKSGKSIGAIVGSFSPQGDQTLIERGADFLFTSYRELLDALPKR